MPPSLANLIAAGEVIERPAAVVKELIENALDAQATRIEVEVEKGGKELIRVKDDGIGILPEDLSLAIQRHTTSKISGPEDLFYLRTLGFRGEALASMAAVSKLRLASRAQEQPWGREILVEGGKIKAEREVGLPVGTVVEVRDLFFNTPARRKFLKKEATELGHIYETVVRLSLAYPERAFYLKSRQRYMLRLTPVKGLDERIGQIYGIEVARALRQIKLEKDGIKIEGFIAPLTYSRPSARDMFFYVNRRWVRSALLNQAVYKALSDLWPKGRYPLLVLFLELPLSEVDVNVHPTKQEVRFKKGYMVQEAIETAVRQGLGERWKEVIKGFEEDVPLELQIASSDSKVSSFKPQAKEEDKQEPIGVTIPLETKESTLFYKTKPETNWRVLGQLWQTYILCETDETLIIIDQHAAHERLNYEKLKRLYEHSSKGQELLTPILLELGAVEAGILKDILPELERIGFALESFGETAFLIRQVPTLFMDKDVRGILEKVLTDLRILEKAPNLTDMAGALLKSMACHLSIRAHDALTKAEMEHLLQELHHLNILHCPHGRPFYKVFKKEEIAKFFHRH